MTKISIHYKKLLKIEWSKSNWKGNERKKIWVAKSANFLIFDFRADGEKATSRAELKILQLELWLEPARLGLITNYHNEVKIALNFFLFIWQKKNLIF